MSPEGGQEPTGELHAAIEQSFGSFTAFKEAFNKQAVGLFGSGWVWLCKNNDNTLEIVCTQNAGTPLLQNKQLV